MKNFELQATFENVLDTFEKDMWGRNADVKAFVELIDAIDENCSVAVDARWGSGKTFFVKQAKMVIDAYNTYASKMDEEAKARVLAAYERLGIPDGYELQPQVAVYYDAWANDNDEDPILSLVYAIMQSVNTDFEFDSGVDCLKVIASIAEVLSGRSVTVIRDALKKEDPMAHIRSQKDLQTQISEFLDSLLPERGNRLVVFVDELDRCKPTFAVRLLERIKHYFNNDRITFVFSVNITELQHTIRKHYGNGFDACRYLDRFFDMPINLPPVDLRQFYYQIGLDHGSWVYERVCKTVIDIHHFTPREIMKFYRMARIAAYKPNHDNNREFEFIFGEEKAVKFCLMFIVPIMIGLKVSNYERYNAFIDGKDSSPMHEVLKDHDIGAKLCEDLLSRNESFFENSSKAGVVTVKFYDKIEAVYNALFVHQYEGKVREVQIGELEFSGETKATLMRAVSTLSRYADHEAQ